MPIPLRVLILEDRAEDALLMASELERAGFDPDWRRVETEAEYRAGLDPLPDVILADYHLPRFGALPALAILRDLGLDVPLLVVSGDRSEEVAVDCMKRGAQDYLLKDRLFRLGPAVAQALEAGCLRAARRAAEDRLADSEARFRSFVETTNDWIWATDRAGRLGYANPAVEAILGYRPEDLLGQDRLALVHEEDRRELEGLLAKCAEGRIGWTGVVLRWRRRDGGCRHLESAAVPVLDRRGEVVGFQGADRDVTERILAQRALRAGEARLRQAQKAEAVGRLADGIAHHFNKLMAVTLGYCDLVLEQLGPDDPLHADISTARRAAARAAQLTRRLLAYSGRQLATPRVLDPGGVVAAMEPVLRPLLGDGVELRVHLGHGPALVEADPDRLEEALLDLVVNARDAMPRGSRAAAD